MQARPDKDEEGKYERNAEIEKTENKCSVFPPAQFEPLRTEAFSGDSRKSVAMPCQPVVSPNQNKGHCHEDETQRVMKGRRKDSVVQKIWDHNVAKTKLAGLMAGI